MTPNILASINLTNFYPAEKYSGNMFSDSTLNIIIEVFQLL